MSSFLVEMRSKLHQIPELAFEEYETAKLIRAVLEEEKIAYEVIGTSTLAFFPGEEDRWIGFRADIDALPLQELGEKEYKSKVDGRMHACGHDGHTTNLLYFAKWLQAELRAGKKLQKSVLLIFQAAEEGKGGAKVIAESESFRSKDFEAIYGLHVYPDLEEGKIGTSAGYLSFQNIQVDIELIGQGCHGAQPHKGIDVILVGAKLVEAYQSIVSRNMDPFDSVIFTIGSFHAGTVRNIIPESLEMLGTIRLLDVALIPKIQRRLEEIHEGFEKAYGVKIHMRFKAFYPPVYNDEMLYERLKGLVPEENFVPGIRLSGSEDFSFYLQEGNKGLFFLLGVRSEEKGFVHALHNPNFDFDPQVLHKGFEVFRDLLIDMGGFAK